MSEVGAEGAVPKKKTVGNCATWNVRFALVRCALTCNSTDLLGLIYYVIPTFLWLAVFSFVSVFLVDWKEAENKKNKKSPSASMTVNSESFVQEQ